MLCINLDNIISAMILETNHYYKSRGSFLIDEMKLVPINPNANWNYIRF